MKHRVLFIGNFLSKQTGTKGVSEKIAESEISNNFRFEMSSDFSNRIFRLLSMVYHVLTFQGSTVHIDVYSGKAFIYAEFISRIAKIRKKHLIMTLHGGALEEFSETRESRVKKVLRRANVLQSPSKYLIRYFQKLGLQVEYLPNPINLNKFPYDRSCVNKYSILWVRAFASIYNPDIPIRVLNEVKKEYPKATLTMIGPDKGELKKIQALIKKLWCESQVTITGPIPNNQLYRYYQTHHVFLNTTSYESFGVAMVEAASCGIPIISNSVGEIPLIWDDNEEILLVNGNSVNDYVEYIKLLFEDETLCKRLSQNAHEKALQFRWERIIPQWSKILSVTNE